MQDNKTLAQKDTPPTTEEIAKQIAEQLSEQIGAQVEMQVRDAPDTPAERERAKNEEQISELPRYLDTGMIVPGLAVYTVEKISPTATRPYATFRPAKRIIVQVHDNGVNNGAVFFTHNPVVISHLSQTMPYSVDTEYDAIYSPLTREQAQYVCKQLKTQMRRMYNQIKDKKNVRQK